MARSTHTSRSLAEEIQRLNLCIPSTLLQCYDAYRTQLLQPLCESSLPILRALEALNSIRTAPETSFHDFFNPVAWVGSIYADREPAGTTIVVSPMALHVANAMKGSPSILHYLIAQDTDRLRVALARFSDKHIHRLGVIAKAGFTDDGVLENREQVLTYIAANCSSSVEALILETPELLTLAPSRVIQMPDMVSSSRQQILAISHKYPVPFHPVELECYTASEIEEYAEDDHDFYLSGRVRHCAICEKCHEALSKRKIQLHSPSAVSMLVDSYENTNGRESKDSEDELRHFPTILPC